MEIAPLSMTPVQPVGTIGITPVAGIQQLVRPDVAHATIGTSSFQDFLGKALGQTNQALLESDDLSRKLAAGEVADLHQVMISIEKASLSLQMTMQARNKIVDAYQEIMRMSI
jgi:flagellar hook-basal body complex protein FliE